MTKLRSPLLSFQSHGSLSKALTFRCRAKITIAEKKPHPSNPKTPQQQAHRVMFQQCTALWNLLSSEQKHLWDSIARPLHMPGFAYFQSLCLKPNPGVYLPLLGGTMLGNIDMDGHDIQNIAPAPYARVYRIADLAIASEEEESIPFTHELLDTDNIWAPAPSPDILKIHSAGLHLITGCVQFAQNATGLRGLSIWLDATNALVKCSAPANPTAPTIVTVTTIFYMSADQYVSLHPFHTAGIAINIQALDTFSPHFSIVRLSK